MKGRIIVVRMGVSKKELASGACCNTAGAGVSKLG